MRNPVTMTAGAMKRLLADISDDIPVRILNGESAPLDLALVGIGYQMGRGCLYDCDEPMNVPERITSRHRTVLLLCAYEENP